MYTVVLVWYSRVGENVHSSAVWYSRVGENAGIFSIRISNFDCLHNTNLLLMCIVLLAMKCTYMQVFHFLMKDTAVTIIL